MGDWSYSQLMQNKVFSNTNGVEIHSDGISTSNNILWLARSGVDFSYTSWSEIGTTIEIWTTSPTSDFCANSLVGRDQSTTLSFRSGSWGGYRTIKNNIIAVQCDDPYIK